MIRRILVALDASPDSLAAAEAAAEMAALLNAELHGLFVEDAELLRLVESPLAREIDLLTASAHDAESAAVEGQLRAHARKAREALDALADRLRIKSSFQVARGTVAQEILTAAAEADLVTLGRIGWTVRHRRDLGKTARALISGRRGRVLLLGRSVAVKAPIVVLYDASDAGRDALDLAVHLADRRADPLRVLLIGDDPDALRAEATGRHAAGAGALWLGQAGPEAVANAVSRQMGGVVIVPIGGAVLGEEHLRCLLDTVACPVLAVTAPETAPAARTLNHRR